MASKGRKPPAPQNEGAKAEAAGKDASVGNSAMLEAMGLATPSESTDALGVAASRAAHALRLAPRPPQQTARWVALLQRSNLPPDRRDAVIARLVAVQGMSEAVEAAIANWLGTDSDEMRAHILDAINVGIVDNGTGFEAADTLGNAIATHTGHDAPAVSGLMRTLMSIGSRLWEDDEEDWDAVVAVDAG